jgi:hypothetical protein
MPIFQKPSCTHNDCCTQGEEDDTSLLKKAQQANVSRKKTVSVIEAKELTEEAGVTDEEAADEAPGGGMRMKFIMGVVQVGTHSIALS